jgi:hypothetical protein
MRRASGSSTQVQSQPSKVPHQAVTRSQIVPFAVALGVTSARPALTRLEGTREGDFRVLGFAAVIPVGAALLPLSAGRDPTATRTQGAVRGALPRAKGPAPAGAGDSRWPRRPEEPPGDSQQLPQPCRRIAARRQNGASRPMLCGPAARRDPGLCAARRPALRTGFVASACSWTRACAKT